MLKIVDIHKTFNPGTINEKKALHGVDLHLNTGDFCTIIGGNGAGKSTVLNAIAGVWPVDQGIILLDDKNVTGVPEHKRAAYLGRVFQDPMTGTCCHNGDTGKSSISCSPRTKKNLKLGNNKKRKRQLPQSFKNIRPRFRRQINYKSRSFIRRTAPSIDFADGYFAASKAITA